MLISIVIPVYNGAATIEKLVESLFSVLGSHNLEIILVNDGSRDSSDKVCQNLYQKYPAGMTYLNLSRNFGEHNAVMAGLNYASGEYVVIMDDDFQNPPEEVLILVNEGVNKKYDIVYSYYKTKKHHWIRNLGSKFTNWVSNFLLDKPKDLYLSSFKCLSRFTVNEIIKYRGPYPYIDGLALRCTRNIGKVMVTHEKRMAGRSGYTFAKLISLWLNMFINFSVLPLRLSTLLGLCFSFFGVLLSGMVVIDKIYHPNIPIGIPSILIAVLIFSGVQLFILGLLGEYIGRLFLSSNQTPQYVLRDIFRVEDK